MERLESDCSHEGLGTVGHLSNLQNIGTSSIGALELNRGWGCGWGERGWAAKYNGT